MAKVVHYYPSYSTTLYTGTPITFTMDVSDYEINGTDAYLSSPFNSSSSIGESISGYAYTGTNGGGSFTRLTSTLTWSDDFRANLTFTLPSGTKSFSIESSIYLCQGSTSYNGTNGFYTVKWGNSAVDQYNTYYYNVADPTPTITAQPTLSLSATSGSSVTLSWTAASVSNQGSSAIYYQYFVEPSSTYDKANENFYHLGTTSGRSVTVSESQIISKCGTGFGASTSGSTCYFYVRAYWDNGSTQGGWVDPAGKAFTYYPTVNAPTSVSLSPPSGQSATVSWTNVLAGNNSQSQAILFIDGEMIKAGITSSNSGYVISEDVWKSCGAGSHSVVIAHEWYGRYAYSGAVGFTYDPFTFSLYTGGMWKKGHLHYHNGEKWVRCTPRYHNGTGWVKCVH